MPSDSSTGGFLTPSSIAPAADLDLDDLLQELLVGVTGLSPDHVRPRLWQTTPDEFTDVATNWCAVGVTDIQPDNYPVTVHDGAGDGSDTLIRHETIEARVSFYGLQGQQYASIARDGLYLSQNHSYLRQYDMSFVGCGRIQAIPEVISQQVRRRYDFVLTLRRKVTRTYSILNLNSAEIQLATDDTPPFTATIEVEPA